MYAVSIRYPRDAGKEFNFEHWAEVHMPLGIATFKQTNGFAPVKVMVQHNTFGMTGDAESSDSYITVWLVFESNEGLKGFMTLHNDRVSSADLTDDFDNYAPLPPALVLGELTVFEDIDDILARGNAILHR